MKPKNQAGREDHGRPPSTAVVLQFCELENAPVKCHMDLSSANYNHVRLAVRGDVHVSYYIYMYKVYPLSPNKHGDSPLNSPKTQRSAGPAGIRRSAGPIVMGSEPKSDGEKVLEDSVERTVKPITFFPPLP